MYKSIKSCVMDSGIQSDFFESHVGVRQGENLSPLLFALFLGDLDTFFSKQKGDTLHYIDKLYNYCNNNVSRMLIINNNNESIYYAPCIRVIKPAQRRFTIVYSIPE